MYSSLKQPESALRLLAEAAKIAKRADVQRLIAGTTTGERRLRRSLGPLCRAVERRYGAARRGLPCPHAPVRYWYRRPGMVHRAASGRPGWLYELGLAQSMNDPTKGLSSLDKALQLKPDFVGHRSSALYYLQGKPEAAVRSRTAAGQVDERGLILDRLGQAYRSTASTIANPARAAQLSPDEPTIVLHLANALAEAEDSESETLMGRVARCAQRRSRAI